MRGSKKSIQPLRRVALTERDLGMLQLTERFYLLSRDQYKDLCGFGSITRLNTRLAGLVRAGLLRRKLLPIYPGRGSAQALYHLGEKSREVLEADPSHVARQLRQVARWDLRQVEHVRAANQVLVYLVTALRCRSEVVLTAYRTEPELRRVFLGRALVPDGWIAWTAGGKRFNAFLEIDLHSESLSAWRDKVQEYVAYLQSGAHQELFGFRSCRVLVLAKSAARIAHLRELAAAAGQLFRFAELATVSSETILGPVWMPAGADSGKRTLMEG